MACVWLSKLVALITDFFNRLTYLEVKLILIVETSEHLLIDLLPRVLLLWLQIRLWDLIEQDHRV